MNSGRSTGFLGVCLQRFPIEGRLCLLSWAGEKLFDGCARIAILPLSRHDQTGQDGLASSALIGSVSESNLSQDHAAAQRLFGLVVGRLNLGILNEGKEVVPLFDDPLA